MFILIIALLLTLVGIGFTIAGMIRNSVMYACAAILSALIAMFLFLVSLLSNGSGTVRSPW